MAVIEFVSGFVLAASAGAAGCLFIKKRYEKALLEVESEIGCWQRVELPSFPADEASKVSNLKASVEDLIGKARSLVQEMELTSQQVRAACDQTETAVQSASGISVTFEQVDAITGSLNQTAVTIEDDFSASESAIRDITSTITMISEAINDLTGSHDILSGQSRKLESAVNQVKLIAENIGQVSDQTKLLALNAAIEAARAGEHGQGFSVVAAEIGKLSDRTASAVRQAFDVLETMTADVESVMGSIGNCLHSAGTTTDQLNNVQEILDKSFKLIQGVNGTARMTFNDLNGSLQEIAAELKNRNQDIESIVHTEKLMATLASGLEQIVNNNHLSYVLRDETASRIGMIEKLLKQTAAQKNIGAMDPRQHSNILSTLKMENQDIEAIWSNDSAGNFIFSEPPAGLANAKVRDWWQQAVTGVTFTSPIYISAITRRPCLTVSVPVYKGIEIVGILGADIGLE